MSSAKARDLEKWWSDQRYARMRAGFQQLKSANAVSDRKLHRHCETIAELHAGFWVPSLSTIERFGETSAEVQNTLRGKPRSLSCLLIAISELYPESGDLSTLAREFADGFDLSSEAPTAAGSRSLSRRTYTRAALDDILSAIGGRTANKVDLPEFPPFNRRFPSTNAKRLIIEGREVLLKDESELPTGTHKAR